MNSIASIVKAATSFPSNYYSQEDLISMLSEIWAGDPEAQRRIERLHRNMHIQGRYLALPKDFYKTSAGFGKTNQIYQETALALGCEAISRVLEADIHPKEISLFVFTTITGLSVPSIDARLMNIIPFSPLLKRIPIFGLGCLGGAAGLARIADYLEGHKTETALLLSIELCSLTMQKDDLSMANLVSSGLFGDGAAAVLLAGPNHPLAQPGQPKIIGSQSVFFPGTEEIMGYEIQDSGFKMILGGNVHELVLTYLRPAIEAFLQHYALGIEDIDHWMVHPGGPKILDAVTESLCLSQNSLELSWNSLSSFGNLSSASVLVILDQLLANYHPQPGSYGLMMAFGPAFCAEFILFQWEHVEFLLSLSSCLQLKGFSSSILAVETNIGSYRKEGSKLVPDISALCRQSISSGSFRFCSKFMGSTGQST